MLLLHSVCSLLLKAKTWMDGISDLIDRKYTKRNAYRTPRRKYVRLIGPEDLEARVTPANVDLWMGGAGGMFSQAANWSINGAAGVPQNGDTLQFGGSVGGANGQNTSAVDNMQGLQPGSLVITGNYNQTITLNNTLQVNGSVNIASTTGATITGSLLSIQPGAGGVAPSFNWGAGTISAPVTFSAANAGGTMTINGSDVTLNNATLTNYGTINWSSANPQNGPGPNINLGTGAKIANEGTFNIQTASTESIKGSGLIQNDGTMQKTGVNQTTIEADYSDTMNSILTVNSGTLDFW